MNAHPHGASAYCMHGRLSEDAQTLAIAANVFVRLFELGADMQRHEADRERLRAECSRRMEEFAAEMSQLDKRLDGDHALTLHLQNLMFAGAQSLIQRGFATEGLEALRMLAAPRQSLVQLLIAYHEKVTFAGNG